MSNHEFLSPQEAAYIAHNSYFTLKDWISAKPTIGMESHANVNRMVMGDGVGASTKAGGINTSLGGTGLAGANLERVFAGSTSGVSTGFGYVLSFSRSGRRHVVIATRGTRAEHSKADLFTDARAAMTLMPGIGPVHKGFRNTFDSVKIGLARDNSTVMNADVVHCIGHSLGGAVATLVAAHFAGSGKDVKLYTFGSPRVGALGAEHAIEAALGKRNILRVAHDLDPVTMVGPFPYGHVNGAPTDENNLTLRSPTGQLLSVANHDMMQYVNSVGDPGYSWDAVRRFSMQVDHDNAVLARWLLRSSDSPGWMTKGAAQGLSILMKMFSSLLRDAGLLAISAMTCIDLFSAAMASGLILLAEKSAELMQWIRQAAGWASVVITSSAQITGKVIGAILRAMFSVLRPIAIQALVNVAGRGIPMPLMLGGAAALAGAVIQ
ncbi:MAG: hypothetical protein RLZZ618_1504 [Pseudomonadota bacterium]|jgi:hypothetical protein